MLCFSATENKNTAVGLLLYFDVFATQNTGVGLQLCCYALTSQNTGVGRQMCFGVSITNNTAVGLKTYKKKDPEGSTIYLLVTKLILEVFDLPAQHNRVHQI